VRKEEKQKENSNVKETMCQKKKKEEKKNLDS